MIIQMTANRKQIISPTKFPIPLFVKVIVMKTAREREG